MRNYDIRNAGNYLEIWNLRATTDIFTRSFELPDGYAASRINVNMIPQPGYLARSESGILYLLHGGFSKFLSVFNPEEGPFTPILDLHEKHTYCLEGGPGDTIFAGINNEIWQISPDGTYEVWGTGFTDLFVFTWTGTGKMFGITRDKVWEYHASGTSREVANGFVNLCDIAVLTDGTIIVSDIGTGDLIRINTDGSKQVVLSNIVRNDPIRLETDSEGNLYLFSIPTNFVRVDPEDGTMTDFSRLTIGTLGPFEFVFFSGSEVVFGDGSAGMVTWGDLNTGESGTVVPDMGISSTVIAVDNDGSMYVNSRDNGSYYSIIKIDENSRTSIFLEGIIANCFAFDTSGGLFVLTDRKSGRWPERTNCIYYITEGIRKKVCDVGDATYQSFTVNKKTGNLLAVNIQNNESIVEYSSEGFVKEHILNLPKDSRWINIDTYTDGTVYGTAMESERFFTGPVIERWAFRYNLTDDTTEIIASFPLDSPICSMGNMCVDTDGTIWFLEGWGDSKLYKVIEGNLSQFADLHITDTPAIASDMQGNLYITSSAGIFKIFRTIP